MDRVLALHAGSRGFDSHRGHMSEGFFRSNRLGYPHPVSSELENSGIRVAVGDCSVIERRRWRLPYQTGTTNTTRTDARRRCVRQWFRTSEPLGKRRYENWNTHTRTQTQKNIDVCGKSFEKKSKKVLSKNTERFLIPDRVLPDNYSYTLVLLDRYLEN